jgi:hypothetical protein
MTRTVRVNRLKLLDTLKANRENHLAVFNAAMAGYKEKALAKVRETFDGLEGRLQTQKADILDRLSTFSAETADQFSDRLTVLHSVTVDLPLPVSYVGAYDAAIDMAAFDTRDELDLSGAEFQCFCRDVWDWTYEFSSVNSTYTGGKSR